MANDEVKTFVKERYGRIAKSNKSYCSPSCCSSGNYNYAKDSLIMNQRGIRDLRHGLFT